MKNNYRDFFDLQIQFATRAADILNIPPSEALLHYTSFHKSFSFGRAGSNPESWGKYAAGLETASSPLEWTCEFYANLPDWEEKERPFGCFDYEFKGAEAAVRIHFYTLDKSGASPLSDERLEARKLELHDLFADVHSKHPEAKTVRGHSWAYNLKSYCRLFPEQYIATLTPAENTFDGTRRWGQFLNYKGGLKPNLSEPFLEKLKNAQSMDDLALCFPYQELAAECPIDYFYTFFGITD